MESKSAKRAAKAAESMTQAINEAELDPYELLQLMAYVTYSVITSVKLNVGTQVDGRRIIGIFTDLLKELDEKNSDPQKDDKHDN